MARRTIGTSRAALLARELAHAVTVVARTRSLAYPRILWRIARQPRLTPGSMRFPFGRIRYLDAYSLRTTYRQIFAEDIYQVAGLGPTPTIVDCGGNIGLSVIGFKQQYPQARILTFEADPALAAVLARNVKALGLSGVTVEAKAVGATSGEVMFQPDGADGGHVIAPDGSATPARAVSIPLVRLSEQFAGPIDLLKLDIEGSEYDVIAELSQSGRLAQVKALICEVHGNPATQQRFSILWEQLTAAGFRLSLRYARAGGNPKETPFAAVPGKYYAVVIYGWRP
jgi:FkbM family methyltransferase